MHSFLICSKDPKIAKEHISKDCEKNQIDKFDISILSFEKSIGIEDIRNFQKKVILRPIKSKTKAVLLDGSTGITIEAQNALLKILEEPPNNTIIYITIPNKNLVLPTIISRCHVIELKEKNHEFSKEESNKYLNILISLTSNGAGNKLKLAQDLAKNKEEIIPELENMIIVVRQKIIEEVVSKKTNSLISKNLNILKSLNKTYTIIKTTNVNQRLALENLFLNL